jgi:hypothetical protein
LANRKGNGEGRRRTFQVGQDAEGAVDEVAYPDYSGLVVCALLEEDAEGLVGRPVVLEEGAVGPAGFVTVWRRRMLVLVEDVKHSILMFLGSRLDVPVIIR